MYLRFISNSAIDNFVKSVLCPNAITIMVDDDERTYVNVFTTLLDTTLHINDFECINIDGKNKDYNNIWRKFMLKQLDIIDPSKKLGDRYLSDLHNHLNNCPICNNTHRR